MNRSVALPSGKQVQHSEICDEVCDLQGCEDEAICNGYTYGMYCKRSAKIAYVPPARVCDGYQFCDRGEDEENCTVNSNSLSSCTQYFSGDLIPVHNYTRCGSLERSDYDTLDWVRTYCAPAEVASYQTNCSDPARVGATCKINGYQSTVSKYLLCFDDNISVCDDHIVI